MVSGGGGGCKEGSEEGRRCQGVGRGAGKAPSPTDAKCTRPKVHRHGGSAMSVPLLTVAAPSFRLVFPSTSLGWKTFPP